MHALKDYNNASMDFTHEEKLAIIFMCYAVIHADSKVHKGEIIALHQINQAFGFQTDYVTEAQNMGRVKALSTLNRMSLQKKQAFSEILNNLAFADNHLHLKEVLLLSETFKEIGIGEDDLE